VIVKGGCRLELVLAMETGIDPSFLDLLEMRSNFFLKMNTQAMDDTISFGMGAKCTILKGTGENRNHCLFRLLFHMFGAKVEVQCLLLKKRFGTVRA
jgi:hypothetical protein